MVNYKHLFVATLTSMCVSRVIDVLLDSFMPKITSERRKEYEAIAILVVFIIILRFFRVE